LFRLLLPPDCDIARPEGEDFYEQDEPDAPYVAHTARLRPRSLNYESLFEMTASSELRADRSPAIDGRCYLVNATTPLVFHMYDDRGAVLVASTEWALAEVRTRFAEWVIP
jgi:hypothetical protein